MKFFHRRMNFYRPLATRKACEIDGVKYEAFQYIKREDHTHRSLRKAYNYKLIGHPWESMGIDVSQIPHNEFVEAIQVEDPTFALKHRGGAWYDVTLNGEVVNDKAMKKTEAEAYLDDLIDQTL